MQPHVAMSNEATTKRDANDTPQKKATNLAATPPARPQSQSQLDKERADWEGMAQPLPEREEENTPKPSP